MSISLNPIIFDANSRKSTIKIIKNEYIHFVFVGITVAPCGMIFKYFSEKKLDYFLDAFHYE